MKVGLYIITMIPQITPEQLATKMQDGESVYLVDVRQPWENEYCRLPGSVLIPLPELAGRTAEVEPPEKSFVVAYCHHGIRSLSAAAILQQAGFDNVASLAGGIDAWSLRVDPKVPRY
jgi:rhodanese-related sulfurtransferase